MFVVRLVKKDLITGKYRFFFAFLISYYGNGNQRIGTCSMEIFFHEGSEFKDAIAVHLLTSECFAPDHSYLSEEDKVWLVGSALLRSWVVSASNGLSRAH